RTRHLFCWLFFSDGPATTYTYPLSLHDALPILLRMRRNVASGAALPVSPEAQIPRVSSYASQPPAAPPKPPAAMRRTGWRWQSRGWYLSLTPALEKAAVAIKGLASALGNSGARRCPSAA